MFAQAQKKIIKVIYQGETKRLRHAADYNALVEGACKAFGLQKRNLKFYYLDEENEVISVTCQTDYENTITCDSGTLKLFIASSVSEAREQLLKNLEESRPLAESLNASQIMMGGPMRSSRIMADNSPFMISDFDKISHNDFASENMMSDLRRSSTINPQSKGCGPDAMYVNDKGTDACNMIQRNDTGCNTARVQTHDQMIDTCVNTVSSGVQAQRATKDMGCDGIKADTSHAGCQMDVAMNSTEVNCQLLIPDGDNKEEAMEQEVVCFKCSGTQVNKKNLPCRKCKGSGVLMSNELSEIQVLVKEEVGEFCKERFTEMFVDYLKVKQAEQANMEHTGVECDVCSVNPIVGIRFKCAVCGDYDLCQGCEKKGLHSDHPFLKIRNPKMVPVKIVCQMKSNPIISNPVKKSTQNMSASQVGGRFSGRFVRESISDQTKIEAGEHFFKIWTFRNDGKIAWPANTKLIQSCGDDLGATIGEIKGSVEPDTEVDITVNFKAPEKEGKYTTFFRLQVDKIKFGQKVWCDIMVVKPDEKQVNEDVKMVLQEEVVAPMQISAPAEQNLAESHIFADKDGGKTEPVKIDPFKETLITEPIETVKPEIRALVKQLQNMGLQPDVKEVERLHTINQDVNFITNKLLSYVNEDENMYD